MPVTVYDRIYRKLNQLVPGGINRFASEPGNHMKLESAGFMDLHLDCLSKNRISMAHNFVQEGDLMADPDMEIRILPDTEMAEALTYQQDSLGLYQQVYVEQGGKVLVDVKAKRELNSFLDTWLSNLKSQGFYKQGA